MKIIFIAIFFSLSAFSMDPIENEDMAKFFQTIIDTQANKITSVMTTYKEKNPEFFKRISQIALNDNFADVGSKNGISQMKSSKIRDFCATNTVSNKENGIVVKLGAKVKEPFIKKEEVFSPDEQRILEMIKEKRRALGSTRNNKQPFEAFKELDNCVTEYNIRKIELEIDAAFEKIKKIQGSNKYNDVIGELQYLHEKRNQSLNKLYAIIKYKSCTNPLNCESLKHFALTVEFGNYYETAKSIIILKDHLLQNPGAIDRFSNSSKEEFLSLLRAVKDVSDDIEDTKAILELLEKTWF